MRALVADSSRSPAVGVADVPAPRPGEGELLVELRATSVNRGEVRAAGRAAPGTVVGWEVAGVVTELGAGVDGFAVGQRVVGYNPKGGSWGEQAVLPAASAAPLADDCDFARAAALPIAGITALSLLRLGEVAAGDRVLVTGAAGGVGLFTVQLAAAAGATVHGQVRNEERGQAVRAAGGEPVVHPGDGTALGEEYDVVLDGIGGRMLRPLLAATRQGGRMVLYGNSDDAESSFRVEELYARLLTVRGFRVFEAATPDQTRADLTQLVDHVLSGRLTVSIQATASLADALPLVRDLYERRVTGKVVLTN